MRFAISFEVPVESGNALEKDPKAVELMGQFLEELKPEAAYFGTARRWGILITNAENQEELMKKILPIWHAFKTYPQVEPVSTLEEFKAAMPKTLELVKRF